MPCGGDGGGGGGGGGSGGGGSGDGGVPRRRHRRTIPAVRLETPAGTDGCRDAPRRVCAFVRPRRGREVKKKEYKEEKDPTRTRGSRVVRQRINGVRMIGCRSIDSSRWRCDECLEPVHLELPGASSRE